MCSTRLFPKTPKPHSTTLLFPNCQNPMAEARQSQTLEYLRKQLASTQADLAFSVAKATEAKEEADVFKVRLEESQKLLSSAQEDMSTYEALLKEAWKDSSRFRIGADDFRREVNRYTLTADTFSTGLHNKTSRVGKLRNRFRSSESLGPINWDSRAGGGSSQEVLTQCISKNHSALVKYTDSSLQKELEELQTKLKLVDAELAREKRNGVEIRSELLDAKEELEGYLSRLEESQLDNLTHFRYTELARAGRGNINTVAMNHEYPCVWESLFVVLIYYSVATALVLTFKDGFEGMTDGCAPCNAIYFVTVMSSSVGYGDIFPNSDEAITLTLWLIFFSGLNNIFTRILFGHLWTFIRKSLPCSLMGSSKRVRLVVFALAAIFLSFFSGTIGAKIDMKNDNNIPLSAIDRYAMSLSYITLTTVGFGNTSFKTAGGRIFASVWILISVPIFSWAASYLNELIFRALRFLWQEWLKPYLRNTLFSYIRNGPQTSVAVYVGSFFSPAIY